MRGIYPCFWNSCSLCSCTSGISSHSIPSAMTSSCSVTSASSGTSGTGGIDPSVLSLLTTARAIRSSNRKVTAATPLVLFLLLRLPSSSLAALLSSLSPVRTRMELSSIPTAFLPLFLSHCLFLLSRPHTHASFRSSSTTDLSALASPSPSHGNTAAISSSPTSTCPTIFQPRFRPARSAALMSSGVHRYGGQTLYWHCFSSSGEYPFRFQVNPVAHSRYLPEGVGRSPRI